MLISMILAWLTVFFCLMAGLKWVARISKNRSANRFFHKIHIPFGILALIAGLLHGILAGNPSFAILTDFDAAPVLFTLNWGTACFVAVILLAVSYLLRKKLRRYWMPVHRVLTVLTLLLLVLHLFDMGISLPARLLEGRPEPVAEEETLSVESVTEAPVSQASAPSVAPTPEPTPESTPELPVEEPSAPEPATPEGSTEEEPDIEEAPEEPQEETPLVTFSGAVLADGSYTGTADGFNGPITLTVTVEAGQVTDITIDENWDTPRFFDYAVSIVDTILGEQSLEVDTVSGATFSSAGILNAVYDALSSAVVEGELLVTEIDLSAIPRGHGH
ncbi:MAG: FMN-binding protein [Oscillospiraceae bacterium]|nr:FMN-binding protein [Oscillospiraceae bacterium]